MLDCGSREKGEFGKGREDATAMGQEGDDGGMDHTGGGGVAQLLGLGNIL